MKADDVVYLSGPPKANCVVLCVIRDGKVRSVSIDLQHFDKYYGAVSFAVFSQIVLEPAVSQLFD